MDYKELAKHMEEGSVVKAVCGDYVVYKRKWLYENIEQEVTLIKSIKDFKPIVDGITRLRRWVAEQEVSK